MSLLLGSGRSWAPPQVEEELRALGFDVTVADLQPSLWDPSPDADDADKLLGTPAHLEPAAEGCSGAAARQFLALGDAVPVDAHLGRSVAVDVHVGLLLHALVLGVHGVRVPLRTGVLGSQLKA